MREKIVQDLPIRVPSNGQVVERLSLEESITLAMQVDKMFDQKRLFLRLGSNIEMCVFTGKVGENITITRRIDNVRDTNITVRVNNESRRELIFSFENATQNWTVFCRDNEQKYVKVTPQQANTEILKMQSALQYTQVDFVGLENIQRTFQHNGFVSVIID